jgi:hypothetical protein
VKKLEFYEHFLNDDLEGSKKRLIEYVNKKYSLNLIP